MRKLIQSTVLAIFVLAISINAMASLPEGGYSVVILNAQNASEGLAERVSALGQMGLEDAQYLLMQTPCLFKSGLTQAEANEIQAEFVAMGATVWVDEDNKVRETLDTGSLDPNQPMDDPTTPEDESQHRVELGLDKPGSPVPAQGNPKSDH